MNCSHLYGIRLCAARADGFNECLPPANDVCEGYVFTGVCLSMGGSGGVPVSVHGGFCPGMGGLCPGGGGLSRGWGVCIGGGESLSRGWGVSVQGGLCPGWGSLSRGSLSWRPPSPYGNERAVRILLECILVWTAIT